MKQPKTMLATYLDGAERIVLRREPVPRIAPDQILVKIGAVGVCGSDVHMYEHGGIGPFRATKLLTLGHESAGTVAEIGSRVKDLRPGDRVALEAGVPCGRCEACKRGRYNLCPDVNFLGCPPDQHGVFCEYKAYNPAMAYQLPANVSLEEGAMMEPLSCAIFACRRGNVKPGDAVVVLGSGPIGLLIMQVARASGARVLICDIVQGRLDMARRLGADKTVNTKRGDVRKAVADFAAGRGPQVVLEAAGSPQTHQLALELAAPGATVVFVGWSVNPEIMLNVHHIGVKELTIQGQFRYCNIYPEAIAMVSAGHVDLKSMITHRYALKDVEEAIRFAARREEGTVKVVVTPDGKRAG